jgi:hypothetical protein
MTTSQAKKIWTTPATVKISRMKVVTGAETTNQLETRFTRLVLRTTDLKNINRWIAVFKTKRTISLKPT